MTERTSIESIIAQDAADCADVSVKLCRKLPTVTIRDDNGVQEDIFMQGHDADEFIKALDGLIEQAPDATMDAALKHLAKPYVDCIWN